MSSNSLSISAPARPQFGAVQNGLVLTLLSLAQQRVVWSLAGSEPLRAREIAHVSGLSRRSVGLALTGLHMAGLVMGVPSAQWRLTARGDQLVDALRPQGASRAATPEALRHRVRGIVLDQVARGPQSSMQLRRILSSSRLTALLPTVLESMRVEGVITSGWTRDGTRVHRLTDGNCG